MKMEEQVPGDSSQEMGPDLERISIVQIKQEPVTAQLQHWEVQWQQFLKMVDSPHAGGVTSQSSEEPTPWDDAETFLGSFEQVAKACRWPKGEWVARLLPALQGEPRRAFCRLEAQDREDYGKVKAAILRGDALSREKQRQHFRCFCYQEAEGPRGAYTQLQDLCSQWLKVERHSKEQILELLILEQLLAVLPPEIRNWVRECGPGNCSEAVALAEDFLSKQRQAQRWEQQVLTKFAKATAGPTKAAYPEGSPVQKETGMKRDQEARALGCIQLPEGERRIPGDSGLMEDEGNILECSRLVIENKISQRRRANSASPLGNERTISGNHPVAQSHQTRESKLDLANDTQVEHNQAPPCELVGTGEDLRLSDHKQVQNPEAPCQLLGCRNDSLARYQPTQFMVDERGQGSPGGKAAGQFPREGTCVEKPPFPCSICGKRFSRNSLLLKHERIHGGEKPYSCPTCGKSFVYSWNLMKHQKKHTGQKPHQCSACGKTFFERSDLIRHERIHTGEKPYRCSLCWRCFGQKCLLHKHERTHLG